MLVLQASVALNLFSSGLTQVGDLNYMLSLPLTFNLRQMLPRVKYK
jgi:hypothetical protein